MPPTPTPSLYSISSNIYVDVDSNRCYTSPPDPLYTVGTSGISISGSTSLSMTTTNGTYATGANLPPGTYTVFYTTLPAVYYLPYPRAGPPPSFSITLGQGCTTNDAHDASRLQLSESPSSSHANFVGECYMNFDAVSS